MASLISLLNADFLVNFNELNDNFISDVIMVKNVNPRNLLPDPEVIFTRAPLHKHAPLAHHRSF